ncbi:MAG: hypothetical protein LBV17_10590 [Treponema sp.]|jgi:hypothetical protein|nr:hypothetical protein [Treponema sp.]
MKRILFLLIVVILFAGCATAGNSDYAQLAASGEDVFAGKNWNAPRRNNMYDRWEFNTNGTFHFVHVHEGKPLDRGMYRYEVNNGTISIVKEGEEHKTVYTCEFKGKTFTLTPVPSSSEEYRPSGGMGALPEVPVTFTNAH